MGKPKKKSTLMKSIQWIFSGIGVALLFKIVELLFSNGFTENVKSSLKPPEKRIFGTWISTQKCSDFQINSEITYYGNKRIGAKGEYVVNYKSSKSNEEWKKVVVEIGFKFVGDWELNQNRLAVKITDLESEVESIKINDESINSEDRRYTVLSEAFQLENHILEEDSYEDKISDISENKMVLISVKSNDSCSKIVEHYRK